MKTLMLGNEAAARGLFEAGCSFVSSYPGTPSTEITECAAKYPEIYAEWAPNEKVAMEAAFGASLSGRRSFCGMKHVGLNVAADPLFTLSYTGVRGGMVIGVADDAGMHSSQNEQDSRHYAIAAKLPMLEPSDAAESLAFAKLAYELSEKFDTPVLLKMCTRVAHAQSVVETSERQEVAPIPYEKDIAKFVMMPACAKARHPIVEQRTLALQAWAETADVNRVEDGADHSIGLISSSTSYQYVKEVCGDKHPVLKLGMIHPLPVEKIRAFAKSVEKVIVVEELDGIIEAHCRSIGVTNVTGKELFGCIGEFSQNYIAAKLGMAVHTGHKLDEMSAEQITARRIAAESGLSIGRLMVGRGLLDEEQGKLANAASLLSTHDFRLNRAPGASVSDIAQAAHLTNGLRLIVVDYLGLVRSDERGLSIYERVTKNSASLKALARSLNVPILCLAQLNRAAEQRADKCPSMADLRDSGAIEQDADAVVLLHRPAMCENVQQKPWEAQTLTAIVAKNRHGNTGRLDFDFWGSSGIIKEHRLEVGGGV